MSIYVDVYLYNFPTAEEDLQVYKINYYLVYPTNTHTNKTTLAIQATQYNQSLFGTQCTCIVRTYMNTVTSTFTDF